MDWELITSRQRKALVITNSKIITVDAHDRIAEALICQDGRFTFVGSNADALKLKPSGAQVIDAKGATMIPGLNDSHTYIVRGGMMYAMELRWDAVSSLEQALLTPKGQWIRVVGGYSWEQFKERRLPTLEEINHACPDHPVLFKYLYAKTLLNQRAVETIEYNHPDAPKYPGGYIARDRNGKATGLIMADPSGLVL